MPPPPVDRLGGNIVKVSWAASAAVGGVLADRYCYRFTFLLTAMLQAAGTSLQASLLAVLPGSEGLRRGAAAESSEVVALKGARPELGVPLLTKGN